MKWFREEILSSLQSQEGWKALLGFTSTLGGERRTLSLGRAVGKVQRKSAAGSESEVDDV